MAEILLAERLGVGGFSQLVVLKRLLPHLAANPDFVHTLADEARIAARVRHRNVVRVLDLEKTGDQLALVMEYVEGKTVLQLLKAGVEQIDYGLGAYIVREACAGLHAAHELGIVHRDITPSNILISASGEVKVLDFGIATSIDRLTKTRQGLLKGKYAYLAPERIQGGHVDRRADVFCLGILLYELTLKRRLFKRSTDVACLHAILDGRVPHPTDIDPAYPEPLERVLFKALAPSPEDRYQTAEELALDLDRVIEMPALPERHLARAVHDADQEDEDDTEASACSIPIEIVVGEPEPSWGSEDEARGMWEVNSQLQTVFDLPEDEEDELAEEPDEALATDEAAFEDPCEEVFARRSSSTATPAPLLELTPVKLPPPRNPTTQEILAIPPTKRRAFAGAILAAATLLMASALVLANGKKEPVMVRVEPAGIHATALEPIMIEIEAPMVEPVTPPKTVTPVKKKRRRARRVRRTKPERRLPIETAAPVAEPKPTKAVNQPTVEPDEPKKKPDAPKYERFL